MTRTRTRDALAFARNTWRGLTSMRTALVLLFLLALAAMPGALLPQTSVDASAVRRYRDEHRTLGPVLENLGMFDVFATPWFAAVYVLLFVSLVGCLLPRSVDYARQLRARPVATPRNLTRLPYSATATTGDDPDQVVRTARQRLRGWRLRENSEPDGARTISAERGYLREAGNLVFHLSLVGLLIAFAAGKMLGYEGQVIVLANGSQFCNTGPLAYDSFRPGLRVDGTELAPFCVRVDDFDAEYLPTGQAEQFRADLAYQGTDDLVTGTWREHRLEVNHPLRTDGERVYLLGHGYAPQFTVTFPDGQQRTGLIQWRPVEQATLLSEGATKFDPPGVTDDAARRDRQLAITGLLAPTAVFQGALLSSGFPELRDPAVAVDVLRGDLGNDSGRGQSIFEVDPAMVESGRLVRVARENLRPGDELTLDDGSRVRFDGVEQWVSLQVSHDPGQLAVLAFSVLVIGGLGVSLTIKRRRWWLRATPAPPGQPDGRTVVTLGGLARTEAAGYGEEFHRIAADLLASLADEPDGGAVPTGVGRDPLGAGKDST